MWGELRKSHPVSLWRMPDGAIVSDVDPKPKGVLPGSFNPLHEGHRELRTAAEAWLNGPVHYELSVVNVDKPPLDAAVIEARLAQFAEHPVWITSAATFVQKAKLLSNAVFIVGADTALRIVEPRYYGGKEPQMFAALDAIRHTGGRFLVAGRECAGTFLTLRDIRIPERHADLFESLPETHFRRDLSSTSLRRPW